MAPQKIGSRGRGGQYAYVIPAYDLVVVHRANSGPGLKELGRLLWLLLDAGVSRTSVPTQG